MTNPAPMPGPACDICGERPSVLSILNYADWQQLKLCATDAPAVMRGIADSMDGGQPAESAEPAGTDAAPENPAAAPMPGEGDTAEPGDDTEPGSARDHWASTTHVRRSTHGHRSTASRETKPREGDPS